MGCGAANRACICAHVASAMPPVTLIPIPLPSLLATLLSSLPATLLATLLASLLATLLATATAPAGVTGMRGNMESRVEMTSKYMKNYS